MAKEEDYSIRSMLEISAGRHLTPRSQDHFVIGNDFNQATWEDVLRDYEQPRQLPHPMNPWKVSDITSNPSFGTSKI